MPTAAPSHCAWDCLVQTSLTDGSTWVFAFPRTTLSFSLCSLSRKVFYYHCIIPTIESE